ncbi:DUF3054 domain-containing protein [Actinomycetospora sp. OC33-EN08]|uniref:DUF3054 domain-containing protein n=1 Tax=Actinomycetospora aurantiaca TaxID=3129233 RepID=A0ABU8MK25_9PSEU
MKHRALALVDVLAVLVFAAIGRRSHDEDGALLGVLTTAAPFLLGAVVGALVARSWRDPLSWRSGVGVWLGAVVVGLALRAVLYERLPVSFAVVATIALAVLVLGWRGAVRGIMALRRRQERQDA